jgi:hypothetical protein
MEHRMSASDALSQIKRAIDGAPRNGYVAELHLQVIKYAHLLNGVSGAEFCESLGLGNSWGTEYAKMKKIAPRLRAAGLRPELI